MAMNPSEIRSVAGHEPKQRQLNRLRSIHSSLAIEGNTLSLEQLIALSNGNRVLGDHAGEQVHWLLNILDVGVFQKRILGNYLIQGIAPHFGRLTRSYNGTGSIGMTQPLVPLDSGQKCRKNKH
jgi:hypothetical protein